ncbi:1,2-phenylacetyl-CoA epoxidase subunit PaaD [Kordiimonas aquimaris]|uniref:1,2-phenylacetyl-CoA epoxidase subunit PaaD n=1 Tax=Kordiimonas aquimaris TaxID=707591 RepID=UPI0021D3E557|nr:1,2-phenylacetyl-CoA epoxidase subunit PaaD [Kordiimonas aquimaris]
MVVEPTYQMPANDAGVLPPTIDGIWSLLHEVNDPEVPVISVVDLGIVRDVRITGEIVTIDVTPTYSGCPATKIIEAMIKAAVESKGYTTNINTVITPPWTTDWISDEGRVKLREYGIAPPENGAEAKASLLGIDPVLSCPQCNSTDSERISEFGSTACKALYKCKSCLEPFEYFKCI